MIQKNVRESRAGMGFFILGVLICCIVFIIKDDKGPNAGEPEQWANRVNETHERVSGRDGRQLDTQPETQPEDHQIPKWKRDQRKLTDIDFTKGPLEVYSVWGEPDFNTTQIKALSSNGYKGFNVDDDLFLIVEAGLVVGRDDKRDVTFELYPHNELNPVICSIQTALRKKMDGFNEISSYESDQILLWKVENIGIDEVRTDYSNGKLTLRFKNTRSDGTGYWIVEEGSWKK